MTASEEREVTQHVYELMMAGEELKEEEKGDRGRYSGRLVITPGKETESVNKKALCRLS